MAETSVLAAKMKAVVFAGGIGTRMWPLSRKSSPKQFEPIIEGKSTLQLTIARLRPEFAFEDIYISTGEAYRSLVISQLPEIPEKNIIGEPEMRDVAPAVGYVMSIIARDDPDAPVALLWSDHLVEQVETFKQALFAGGDYLLKNPDHIVFLGQKPRFANQNLGWIEYGEALDSANGIAMHAYKSWHYRPDLETAKQYFSDGHYAWNPGYFVVTPAFILQQFALHVPEMYAKLKEIVDSYGSDSHAEVLKQIYPTLQKTDLDSAVIQHIPFEQAVVLSVDLGWSDVGTWESLKEALQKHERENITMGQVHAYETTDSVVYSSTKQVVVPIGLEGMVVVVTDDVVMVTRQESIPEIKNMLKEFEGTDLEKYS